MKKVIVTVMALGMLSGCQSILKTEPAKGQLRYGSKVLVDDGTCPSGQVKQVTGGNGEGIPRKRECVPMPAK